MEYFDEAANETVILDHWATLNKTTHVEISLSNESFPSDFDLKWNNLNYTDSFGYWNPETGSWARKVVPCEGPIPPKVKAAVMPELPFTWSLSFDDVLTEEQKTYLIPKDPETSGGIMPKKLVTDDFLMSGGLSPPTYLPQHDKKFVIDMERMHINLRGPTMNLPLIESFDDVGVMTLDFPLFMEVEREFMTSVTAVLRNNLDDWPIENSNFTHIYTQVNNWGPSITFTSNAEKRADSTPRQGYSYLPVELQVADEVPFYTRKVGYPYYTAGWFHNTNIHPGSIPRQTLARFRMVFDFNRGKEYVMYRIESDKNGPRASQPWKLLSSISKTWTLQDINKLDTFTMFYRQMEVLWYGTWYPGFIGVDVDKIDVTYYPGDYYVNIDSFEIQATCSATPLANILSKIPPVARYHAEDFDGTTWKDSSGNGKDSIAIQGTTVEKVTELGVADSATVPQTYVRGKCPHVCNSMIIPVNSRLTSLCTQASIIVVSHFQMV